ncbi:major facilitator superfamily domain-containing protein [Limtongia smithiae]|uniref:major facilitator superfamily domain-containing protein n=1 Tax=Limtongia smithiae TaxID=1125753 RepID=UPI0034CFA7F8
MKMLDLEMVNSRLRELPPVWRRPVDDTAHVVSSSAASTIYLPDYPIHTTFDSTASTPPLDEIREEIDPIEEIAAFTPQPTTTDAEKYVVTFDGVDDPSNPLNWPFYRRAYITLIYALCTFGPQVSSSIYGAVATDVAKEYDVPLLVSMLGVTVFMLGIGLGPLFFAPVSELYGRKKGVLYPLAVSGIFSVACAVSRTFPSIMITRFFEGFFGGAPVANSGGVLGDIWRPRTRAIALVAYGLVVTGGPAVAPLIGAAFSTLGQSTGWRWTQYFSAIYMLTMFTIGMITVPETYAPLLLVAKARSVRAESGNTKHHARLEELELSFSKIVTKHLTRPLRLLCTPIVLLISVYGAFVFGVLYISVTAVPVAFADVRSWPRVIAALPSLGVFCGCLLGAIGNVSVSVHYGRVMERNGGRLVPEERLHAMKIGSLLMPVGLFLFGWTASPQCFWLAPVAGLALLAAGFTTIFQGCLNYLIDAFPRHAASVVAATTFLRSVAAAGFPIVGRVMFTELGVPWGASIIAFVAVVMVPIPFAFYRYGAKIREKVTIPIY